MQNINEEFVDIILVENDVVEITEDAYRVFVSYAKTLDEETKKKIKEESGVAVNTTAGIPADTPTIKRRVEKRIVEKEDTKSKKKHKYVVFHNYIKKKDGKAQK